MTHSGDLNYFHTQENIGSLQTSHHDLAVKPRVDRIKPDGIPLVSDRPMLASLESSPQLQKEFLRLKNQLAEEQREKERKLEAEVAALKKEVEAASRLNDRLAAERLPSSKHSNQHWGEGWRQMEKTYMAELKTREKNLTQLDLEQENLSKEISLVEMELDQITVQSLSLHDVTDVLNQEVVLGD